MRRRIGGCGRKLLESFCARGGVLLLHPFLVCNGLLLHEFDVQRSAMTVIQIKSVDWRFTAEDAA